MALKLDEERIAQLLGATAAATASGAQGDAPSSSEQQQQQQQANANLIGQLLGCYGELFSTSVDLGWMEPDSDGLMQPRCEPGGGGWRQGKYLNISSGRRQGWHQGKHLIRTEAGMALGQISRAVL